MPSDYSVLLLGPGLLTTEGTQHRRQRKMLTPVFSTAHLRNMTPLFYETSHKVRARTFHGPTLLCSDDIRSCAVLSWASSAETPQKSTS